MTSSIGPCSIVVLDSPPPPDSIMVGLTDDLPILLDTGLDRPSLSLLWCLGRDLESPTETAKRGTWSFCSQNKPSKYDWINQNCLPGINKVLIENLYIWTKNPNLSKSYLIQNIWTNPLWDLRQIQTFPIMHWGLSPQSELKTVGLSTVSCDMCPKRPSETLDLSLFYSQKKLLNIFLKIINRLTDVPSGQLRTDNKSDFVVRSPW